MKKSQRERWKWRGDKSAGHTLPAEPPVVSPPHPRWACRRNRLPLATFPPPAVLPVSASRKKNTAQSLMKTTLMRDHPSFKPTVSETFPFLCPCKRTLYQGPCSLTLHFCLIFKVVFKEGSCCTYTAKVETEINSRLKAIPTWQKKGVEVGGGGCLIPLNISIKTGVCGWLCILEAHLNRIY